MKWAQPGRQDPPLKPRSSVGHGALALCTKVDGPVAIVHLGPGARIATEGCWNGVASAVRAFDQDVSIASIVLIGSLGDPTRSDASTNPVEPAQRSPFIALCNAISDCRKPVVAALRGFVDGPTFELALSCDGRVCDATMLVAVQGFVHDYSLGTGALQRLVRLVGRVAAAKLVSGSREAGASEARSLGIVDDIVEGDLLAGALAHIRSGAVSKRDALAQHIPAESAFEALAALSELEFANGVRPRLRPVLALLADAGSLPAADEVEKERKVLDCYRRSDDARALRYHFKARGTARSLGIEGATSLRVQKVGVVGGGAMGRALSRWLRDSGLLTVNVERQRQSGRRVRSSRATADASDWSALADCDFVIEAVTEDFEAKADVLIALDQHVRPDCILATTTTHLDVEGLSSATVRPSAFCGIHFAPSATSAAAAEIVRTSRSAPETLRAAASLALKVGALPVIAGDAYGFIGTRMMTALSQECANLADRGASPYLVRRALQDFGFRGVVLDQVLPSGAAHAADIRAVEAEGPAETLYPILLRLANEACCIVEDGVASSPEDIDLLMVAAYGFPAWEGGPVYWARHRETPALSSDMMQLRDRTGPRVRAGNPRHLWTGSHRQFESLL